MKNNHHNPHHNRNQFLRFIYQKGYDSDPKIQCLLRAFMVSEHNDPLILRAIQERVQKLETDALVFGICFNAASDSVSGPIPFGITYSCSSPGPVFGMYPSEFNEHGIIVGSSGSGKTSLLLHALNELLSRYCETNVYPAKNHRLTLQIYDINSDYIWLYKKYPHILILPITKRPWNPLQISAGIEVDQFSNMFCDIFCSSFYILDVGRNILRSTLMQLYRRFGVLDGSKRFPTMRQLMEALKARKFSGYREKEACASLINRIDGLLATFGKSLDYGHGFALEELRSCNVVYDLSGISLNLYNFIIGSDVANAYLYHKTHQLIGNKARTIFVFDEAHLVFPSALRKRMQNVGETPLLFSIYPMLRTFGIGIWCLTQSPRSIDDVTILSNTGCKIVKSLFEAKDIATIGDALFLNNEQRSFIREMDCRQAVAGLAYRWQKPFCFGVPEINVDKKADWTEIERHMHPRYDCFHIHEPFTPPIPEFRDRKKLNQKDQALVKQLLFDVLNHPFITLTERYTSLFQTSGGKGDRIKRLAIQWGYAIEIKIHTGLRSGQKTFLQLTKDGYDFLNISRKPLQGIGNFEHQYWQHRIYEECVKRGYKASIEMQSRGKRVDVGVSSPIRVAFEIATCADNELNNAQNDVGAGFNLVIICATSQKVKQRIETILLSNLPPSLWVNVEIHRIQEFLVRPVWF